MLQTRTRPHALQNASQVTGTGWCGDYWDTRAPTPGKLTLRRTDGSTPTDIRTDRRLEYKGRMETRQPLMAGMVCYMKKTTKHYLVAALKTDEGHARTPPPENIYKYIQKKCSRHYNTAADTVHMRSSSGPRSWLPRKQTDKTHGTIIKKNSQHYSSVAENNTYAEQLRSAIHRAT